METVMFMKKDKISQGRTLIEIVIIKPIFNQVIEESEMRELQFFKATKQNPLVVYLGSLFYGIVYRNH